MTFLNPAASASADRVSAVEYSALHTTGCPDCGTLQHVRRVPGTAQCLACHSVLSRGNGRSLTPAFACASAALLLLFPANLLPLLTTSILGVSRGSVLASSSVAMLNDGWPELAIVIGLFVVVLPFVRFGLLTAVLGALVFDRRPKWLGRAFRRANALQTWAMPDVFLLGFAVAYARLASSISVEVGDGAICFIGVGVLALFTRATLAPAEVWRSIGPDRVPAPGEPVLSCSGCELLLPLSCEGSRCPRCAATLHSRKPHAVGRALALTLAAALLYMPANFFAMATMPIGFKSVPYTVLEGVIDLADAGLYGLALLVFSASFAIPLIKLAGMAWCIASVLRRSARHLVMKTRLYRVVEEIGRWSMVDPFVIACFVPVTQYNALIHGRADAAAPAFAAVVILTMIATHIFDPRLMWDAAATSVNPPGSPMTRPR